MKKSGGQQVKELVEIGLEALVTGSVPSRLFAKKDEMPCGKCGGELEEIETADGVTVYPRAKRAASQDVMSHEERSVDVSRVVRIASIATTASTSRFAQSPDRQPACVAILVGRIDSGAARRSADHRVSSHDAVTQGHGSRVLDRHHGAWGTE